jgi:ABC-type protease/lipase transport system fused ATPase/permease subunit
VTVVLVTHRLNLLGLADKVLLLRAGAVEAFGPRDEIMARLSRPATDGPLRVVPGAVGGAAGGPIPMQAGQGGRTP